MSHDIHTFRPSTVRLPHLKRLSPKGRLTRRSGLQSRSRYGDFPLRIGIAASACFICCFGFGYGGTARVEAFARDEIRKVGTPQDLQKQWMRHARSRG